jgi:hypothetical protein
MDPGVAVRMRPSAYTAAALLAAAERTDRLVDGDSTDASRRVLIVGVGALAACIGYVVARVRLRNRTAQPVRKSSGAFLENLRKAHSVANARS